jgi:hypothetical protein
VVGPDEGIFTTPWTATMTYGRGLAARSKAVSAGFDDTKYA